MSMGAYGQITKTILTNCNQNSKTFNLSNVKIEKLGALTRINFQNHDLSADKL